MKRFDLPLTDDDIRSLKAGDVIELNGFVYTARDAAHKRICEALKSGEKPPIELNGAVIYYCGPTPARDGEIIGSCGPTTSARMDDYAPTLIEHGAKVMIGKGKRSGAVTQAIKDNCGLYLAAIGGAGALLKSYVKSCELVAYPDLGCESIYRLKIESMQLIVATDCRGESILK